ncbi:helix-turn-helix domain-containing protein [Corynebacterium auris]|uniref:helix-turn-helix domain-containing protein n=1 Tax=Corynebacterium auris TaxID=44750 RepID=UPI0025B2E90E|nr:helix-turn-helix transcriptional regulator [Corynebacterium auris]WJY67438.1 anaerobic benzoate catabolism transcriptional regulator [Corynebacterium auris]
MADVLPKSYWASYGYVLAVRLRTLRVMRGLTQRRLAELSGLSRSLISNLERNHYNCARSADPTLSTLYRIAHALHVPPAALLPGVGDAVGTRCADRPLSLSPLRVEWPLLPEDTARFDSAYLLTGPAQERPPFALMLDSGCEREGGAGAIHAGC